MPPTNDLKALAEKATKEPRILIRYDHGGGRMYQETGTGRKLIADTFRFEDREFIAACSPDVILGLLAEVERLRAALTELVACKDYRIELFGRLMADPGAKLYAEQDAVTAREIPAWSAARAALKGVEG